MQKQNVEERELCLCERFFSRKGAKARKGAKKTLNNAAALCAFAPLREKSSSFVQSRLKI